MNNMMIYNMYCTCNMHGVIKKIQLWFTINLNFNTKLLW